MQGSDHEPHVCHAPGNGYDTVLRNIKEYKRTQFDWIFLKSLEKSWMEMMAEKEIWEKELILFDYDNTVLLGKGSDEDI